MKLLTDEEIQKLAQKYCESYYSSHTSGEEPSYHFISGANHVNNYYKKDLEEIQEKVYGKYKFDFIFSHLLRSFSIQELITIRDFLIERTPK